MMGKYCVRKSSIFLEKYMRQSVLFNLDGGRGTFCRSVAARFAKNLSFCCDEGKKNQYFHSSTSPYGKWTEAEKLWVPAAAACAIGGGGNDA